MHQQTCHQLQPSIPAMQPNDLAVNHAMNSNSSVFGIEAKALLTAISSWHGDLARDCSGFQLRKPALWKEQGEKKKTLKWYHDMLWFSTLELPALWKEEQKKVNLMVGAASCIVERGRGQDWRLLQTSSPWIIHSAMIEIKRKQKKSNNAVKS